MKTHNITKPIIIAAVAVALVTGLVVAMERSINRSVYSERKQMLSLVTSTSAAIVNQIASMEWDFQNLISEALQNEFSKSDKLEDCIAEVSEMYDLGDDYFFLVNEEGKYFCSDGAYGKLTDFTYYSSSTDTNAAYLATLPHKDQGKTFLIMRSRWENPVAMNTSHGKSNIVYFAFAHELSSMNNTISDLFPGATNVFIYDSDGAMLYKEFGINLLIDGYNIFSKFNQVKLRFKEKPEELVSRSKNRESIVVDMVSENVEYYFCSAPIDISDWSLAFMVHSDHLDDLSENSFSGVIIFISLIAFILGAAILIAIATYIRNRSAEERLVESQKLTEALKEVSRAKTEFLSNMSHDIRTPINGIMGMTTIAQGAIDDKEKVGECLSKIEGASHHLLSLINDVLDMSRIESGKTKISEDPTDIRIICDNCCSIVKGQMAGRDLEFNQEIEAEHTGIFADELHLRQIFINILGNAVKFTKDGGAISFRCQETAFDDENVTYRFEVEDTGIGISKEYIGKIFEPFSQEKSSERTNYAGTGLGMSITKNLVELMNGRIEVESELGKGSNFIVTITFKRNLEERVEEQTEIKGADIKDVKILLVEDNELNLEIAKNLLEVNGAIVDTATDGQEAIDKFAGNGPGRYDVILMDIMMPRVNGLEATKEIRGLDREDAALIPIIAMTANAFEDDVKATMEAGMNAHLSKPIDIDVVIRTIYRQVADSKK